MSAIVSANTRKRRLMRDEYHARRRQAREMINRALDNLTQSALEQYRVDFVDDDEALAFFGVKRNAYSE